MGRELTVVDRYYLAWMEYQARHGVEPAADEVCAFLVRKGMFGRAGKPVSPTTLRRYPLRFRTYGVRSPVSGDDDDLAADPAGFTEAVDVCEVGQRV
ncbi:hypothetical protein [Streptomyces sp. NPDC047453]|uniref:hypothetical protein n=1 Tax=Streptomyces sp. NPDC047453 TaxID=3154812 RepID=UPI0033D03AC2